MTTDLQAAINRVIGVTRYLSSVNPHDMHMITSAVSEVDRLRAQIDPESMRHWDTLLSERDAARAALKEWPSIECPCCGEEAAFATFFEDGQATVCGCEGRVSADGSYPYIIIDHDTPCPKCDATAAALKAASEAQA